MFKVGLEFMNKEFCVEAGYNRRAKKITPMLFVLIQSYRTMRNKRSQKTEDKGHRVVFDKTANEYH